MEASQAATGQQSQGQGEGAAAQQGQAGPDVAQLSERFEQMSQGQQEMLDYLRSNPWEQAAQEPGSEPGQQPAEALDLSFLDDTSPNYDPAAVAERLQQVINHGIEQGIQQHVNPVVDRITQERAEERRQRDAETLVGEFPELAEPETAQQVVGLAREMAQVLGQPALADDPKFWRYAYMAGRAAEAANQEGAESPRAAHLEGGGGAAPAPGSQVDLGDQIVQAGQNGRRVLPF